MTLIIIVNRCTDIDFLTVALRVKMRRCPKEWPHGTNYPLFWAQTKSSELYVSLLKNHNIKSVFDLCGSTSLMDACLTLGLKYVGVALSPVHATWLESVADRMAAKCVVQQEHPLYQADLAESLSKMFTDEVQPKESSGKRNPSTP